MAWADAARRPLNATTPTQQRMLLRLCPCITDIACQYQITFLLSTNGPTPKQDAEKVCQRYWKVKVEAKVEQTRACSTLNLNLGVSLLHSLRPCPRNGASMGEEAALADSWRAGEKSGLSEQPAMASQRVCEYPDRVSTLLT
jgi:hypothetical protein